ncbi:kinase-like protein [Mytilinidion resinicola]|uniref:Kinase-like protein n=1 Tax=Mytilinidion resinicola TaxID=574789 RepID=A0A6A6YQW8_9PEZI|nr:kinase-like protein [Mytilinidion resinicola]KAF2811180.1 kinase-like protein [Mytilinidion resinicola]
MALRVGQTLRGSRWDYLLIEALGNQTVRSNVFKAEIISRAQCQPPGKWAVIKTSSEKIILKTLKNEYNRHMNPAIRSSKHFRAMYDAVDIHNSSTNENPYCLAFEWMDCTLKDVCSGSHGRNSALHKNISGAVLGALADLESQQLVHTDIKNDNILISDLDGPSPVVKLGDLGLVRSEGFNRYPLQPFAMRAPEVWSGIGCFHCSDVWAFAVTLFDWIVPCVFGANDMPQGHWQEAWAMAKLLRLFPDSVKVHPTDPNYQDYFEIAELLEKSGYGDSVEPRYIGIGSFEEELKKMDIPLAVSDFLRYLFVVDYTRRPTAVDALKSQQFQRLR